MKGVKFNKGDKIFAKVRGYPPWPAKIEAVADETPSKMKYHVYFFGTAETAIVKAEDICLYGPNRSKLGKRKKHKNFAEAMEEIEASLTPEERAAFDSIEDVDKLDESKESRLDESKVSVAETTVEDEDDDKSKKQKPKAPAKKDRKRKLDEEKPRETKRQKTEDAEDVKEEKVEPKQEVKEETEEKKEVLSRSGRKIKPKRYLDEEDEEKDTKDFIIAKKDGQIVKIPLNLNKPKIADRYESEWSQMVLEHATALKKQIENGEFKENVHSHMDEWTKAKSEEISAIENSESMRILDTEMDLLDNVNAIKKALTLDEAKCDKAISAFESLDRLSLTPLMLKKNPDTVYSIAKILNYKGNVKNWKLSEQELATFNENAEIIRKKAEHFYNKIIALFLVPGNQEFIIHFESEVASFNEKYAQLSAEEMVALTKEE